MSEKEIKTLILRLPMAVYERVKNAATENQLSVNAFIVNALSETPETETLEMRIQAIEKRLDEIDKKLTKKK